MSGVVDREEIETMMWTLADVLAEVRNVRVYLMGDDDEEEGEEADS